MTKETIIYLYNNRVKINAWLFENGLSTTKGLFYSSIDIKIAIYTNDISDVFSICDIH